MTPPTPEELLPALHEIKWIPGKDYSMQLDEHYKRLHAAYMALRAELAGAEERGAARERASVVTWLPRQMDRFDDEAGYAIETLASDIERGGHVRTGTAAADEA